MSSILIFASDHRKNVNWNLPYIRLGCSNSNAIINIDLDDEIHPYSICMSEGAQMWWAFKHLNELGNPDYVGFCHYRRFFSFYTNKRPLLDIPSSIFLPTYCMTPKQLLDIILQNNLDGIVPHPLKITSNFIDIKQLLIELAGKPDNLNIPKHTIDIAFDTFFNNASTEFRRWLIESMKNELTYVCNIFTIKRELFNEYISMIIPACIAAYNSIEKNKLKYTHPRFVGYILERLTSLYLHAIQIRGNRLMIVPLMTLDGSLHVQWKVPTE